MSSALSVFQENLHSIQDNVKYCGYILNNNENRMKMRSKSEVLMNKANVILKINK